MHSENMLTSSLYTRIAIFILFKHYFSVLPEFIAAIPSVAVSDYDAATIANELNSDSYDGSGQVVADAAAVGASEVDGGLRIPGSASAGPQRLPVFPERPDAVYFIVAVVGGAKVWGRLLAKTLLDLGPPFNNPHGPPLRPIYVDMPRNGRYVYSVTLSNPL